MSRVGPGKQIPFRITYFRASAVASGAFLGMISDELACAGTDPMTYMGHRRYSTVDENSRASSLEYQLQLPETELGEVFTAPLEDLNDIGTGY